MENWEKIQIPDTVAIQRPTLVMYHICRSLELLGKTFPTNILCRSLIGATEYQGFIEPDTAPPPKGGPTALRQHQHLVGGGLSHGRSTGSAVCRGPTELTRQEAPATG